MKNATSPLAVIVLGSLAWGCQGQVDIGAIGDGGTGNLEHAEDVSAPPMNDPGLLTTEDAGIYPYEAGPGFIPDEYPDSSPGFLSYLDASPDEDVFGEPSYPIEDGQAPTVDAGLCSPLPNIACAANCCTVAGPSASFASAGAAAAALKGKWMFCDGWPFWDAVTVPGANAIEFTPDASGTSGTATFLGGVTSGFDSQWTYAVTSEGGSYVLELAHSSTSSFTTTFHYSPCPTELQLDSLGAVGPGLLVPWY
jgi:hypothetical protein